MLQLHAGVKLLAAGDAARVRLVGEADAERVARVGVAQALAIDEQTRAYGGPQLQLAQQVLTRFAEAVEHGRIDIVPRVVLGGGNAAGGQTNAFEALMGMLLSDRMRPSEGGSEPRDPRMDELAQRVRGELMDAMRAR